MKACAVTATVNEREGAPGQGDGFWVYTPYLRKIRKECRDPNMVIQIYVALCRHASDVKALSFRVSEAYIGSLEMLPSSASRKAMKELARIGLISVEPPSNRRMVPYITLLGKARL
jgi:hypothetical protein